MIDGGNQRLWPEFVRGRLAAFRQGSLVRSPPFAYHASTEHPLWLATRQLEPTLESPVLVELDAANRPPYGIITTQSCDIDEEGRDSKPWVQLAPVYRLPDENPSAGLVRSWRVGHLAPVTALDPGWVADLRIEVPVEKSWLVLQQPIVGYTSQQEFDRFSTFCGDYRSRLAVASAVHDGVLKPLGARLEELRRVDRPLHVTFAEQVQHLFLDISGDALHPRALQLVFVSDVALSGEIAELLDGWWEGVASSGALSFALLANRYLLIDEVRFAEYRQWREHDLARLTGSS